MTEEYNQPMTRTSGALQDIPHFTQVKEPPVVVMVATGRAGTKIFQSFLDDHDQLLMVPAYPLMYLYPHWNTWSEQHSSDFTWEVAIDLFCEKHASVLDSRKVPGLSGLDRLGPQHDQHIKIDEELFRTALATMLIDVPVLRRTFLLAVHYAYAICKGWNLDSGRTLFYHLHDPTFLKELADDFPNLSVWTMVREPKASLASTFRAFGIVDQEKLNPTDSIKNAGRNFRIDCRLEFQVLDQMGTYLSPEQTLALSHEGLQQDLEGTMKLVSQELGLDFSPSLLQSTFDGKLWWGDVTNKTPVNGLDPNHKTNRWDQSMGKMDAYVVEGITSDFYDKYKYERVAYRKDTTLSRILLVMMAWWPTRVERKLVGFYFDPRTHLRFIRAAIGESTGRIPRKDYSWNATYLYKWSYLELKLWKSRWYERFLIYATGDPFRGSYPTAAAILIRLSRIVYVGTKYLLFWGTILTYPVQIVRRWRIYYGSLWKRLKRRTFLPKVLN